MKRNLVKYITNYCNCFMQKAGSICFSLIWVMAKSCDRVELIEQGEENQYPLQPGEPKHSLSPLPCCGDKKWQQPSEPAALAADRLGVTGDREWNPLLCLPEPAFSSAAQVKRLALARAQPGLCSRHPQLCGGESFPRQMSECFWVLCLPAEGASHWCFPDSHMEPWRQQHSLFLSRQVPNDLKVLYPN